MFLEGSDTLPNMEAHLFLNARSSYSEPLPKEILNPMWRVSISSQNLPYQPYAAHRIYHSLLQDPF